MNDPSTAGVQQAGLCTPLTSTMHTRQLPGVLRPGSLHSLGGRARAGEVARGRLCWDAKRVCAHPLAAVVRPGG